MQGPAETHVISRSYLSGLIVKCCLFFAAGLIITGAVLYLSSHQPLGPSYQESFSRLSQLKEEMLYKSIFIYSTLMVLVVAGVFFITLIYSHRVVGPMVGLKRIITGIGDGDMSTPAVLRNKDAIKPMAQSLNDLMSNYKSILGSITSQTSHMRSISSDNSHPDQLAEISSRARKISETIKKMKL